MGGGDVKLLAACALLRAARRGARRWSWPSPWPAGCWRSPTSRSSARTVPVPALARPGALPARALRAEAWRIRRRGPLPYGVAIALGTFFTLLG